MKWQIIWKSMGVWGYAFVCTDLLSNVKWIIRCLTKREKLPTISMHSVWLSTVFSTNEQNKLSLKLKSHFYCKKLLTSHLVDGRCILNNVYMKLISLIQYSWTNVAYFVCSSLQGFGVTWVRTLGLMTTYFMLVDSGRRHFPDLFSRPAVGPFLTSGIAATLAWWIVWPFEYMKAQVQSGYGE